MRFLMDENVPPALRAQLLQTLLHTDVWQIGGVAHPQQERSTHRFLSGAKYTTLFSSPTTVNLCRVILPIILPQAGTSPAF